MTLTGSSLPLLLSPVYLVCILLALSSGGRGSTVSMNVMCNAVCMTQVPPSHPHSHPHSSSSVGSSEARQSASSSDETAHVCTYVRLIRAMLLVVHSSVISLKDESTTIPNVSLIVASLWWCSLEVRSKSVGSTLSPLSKSYAPLTSPTV